MLRLWPACAVALTVCHGTASAAPPVVSLEPAAKPAANPAAADKSGYTLFNPTPDDALRTFSPDRPTKSNGPLTVDAGRFPV